MKHHFHPAAEAEHLDHIAFYESRQRGLGKRYLAEVEAAIEFICEAPHRLPIERASGLRRCHLKRFPITLVFHETSNGEILIIAVAHKRRRPGYWSPRV